MPRNSAKTDYSGGFPTCFAHIHRKWLEKWIALPNGIPVQQTVINLFSLIDPTKFSQCIIAHLLDLYPELAR